MTSETHKLHFFNYITDNVNRSRVQQSLFGEDERAEIEATYLLEVLARDFGIIS